MAANISISRPDGSVEVLYEPQEKQLLFHESNLPNLIMEGRRGTGKSLAIRWDAHMRALASPGFTYLILRRTMPELRKALALDTLIPTPNGWTTMGALQEGDTVYAPDGQPTRVQWKSPTFVDEQGTYRVTFDNGESIVASAGHEWCVSTRAQRRTNTHTVRTTLDIAKRVHAEKDGRSNYAVHLAEPWADSPDIMLPIDPYVLGAWLGNGTRGQGAITTYDQQMVDEYRAAGYHVVERPAHPHEWSIRGLMVQLRSLSVLYSKQVPAAYLAASESQRLSLLQGLMDTDGWCREDGWCAFAQTNERKSIAEAVFQLAASLGLKPRWSERPARLNGKDCGTSYEVAWTGNLPVFRLSRKLARLRPHTRGTTNWHYVVSCEQIADTPCQCIAVEHPSHQFLAGRACIPTHNSHLIYISREMDKLGGKYLKTTAECHYANGSIGLMGHCETEQDIERYLSAQFAAIYFDEITTFPFDMVTRIASSCRVEANSGLTAIVRGGTNPLGVSAEDVYRYFIGKSVTPEEDPDYNPNDWGSLHLSREDNKHLDHEQYDKRFSGLPDAYRRAWLDGEWGVEGAYFSIQPKHLVDEIPLVADSRDQKRPATEWPWLHVYRLFDYGWHDPTVCVWVAVLPNGQEVAFQEASWVQTPIQTINKDIKSESEGMRVITTIADPTIWDGENEMGHSLADEMENAGIDLTKGKNDRVATGLAIQNHLNSVLADGMTPRLVIYEPGCPTLVRSLRAMRVDKRKPGRIADHKMDHMPICLGYFCMAGVGPTRVPNTVTIPRWMVKKTTNHILGSEGVRNRR